MSGDRGLQLNLLGGFELISRSTPLRLSLGARRLVAFLALHKGGAHRAQSAEELWPNNRRARADANLRSALWHANRLTESRPIESLGPRLRLAEIVAVDLCQLTNSVHRVDTATESVNGHNPQQQMIHGLGLELLPDWSDDWLLLDRERWNQIRLHGLETLAGQLMLSRNYLSALEVALAAVAIEPIRESAHRAVIEIHIAEGNLGSALKHYQRYRAMLQREIGASPSHRMDSLVRRLLPD